MKKSCIIKANLFKPFLISIIFICMVCMCSITAFAANTANDSFSSAESIRTGTSYSGEISQSSTKDYYKFTIEKSGSVNVRVTTTMGYTYYKFYNSSNNEVWSTNPKNGQVDTDVYLVAGTYYFAVLKDTSYGTYNFKLDFTSANESFHESMDGQNNKFETASKINTDTSYIGQIGVNDTVDYYKFTIEESGGINIKVTTTMGYTYYKIYNSTNNEIWSVNPKNGQVDTVVELISGTYYFAVIKDTSYGIYNFKLDYTPTNESFAESSDSQNNKFTNASNIVVDTQYVGQIAINDTVDYYKFTLSESGGIHIKVNTTMGYTYYKIYNNTNNEIWSVNPKNGQVDTVVQLMAGTYYFATLKDTSYGSYNFKLDYTSAKESFPEEEDNQNNKINNSSLINVNTSYVGQIAINDTVDYYKFSVPSTGSVNVKVNTTELGYTYYRIYDINNSQVWSVNPKNGQVDTHVELNAGTYYFAVMRDNSDGKYTFALYPAHECLGPWRTTANPTCTTEGMQERNCTTCGKQIETAAIPATGHTITAYSIQKDATCHAAGSRSGICDVCGETIYEDIEILTHQYGDFEIVSGSKLIPPIVREKTCSLCGEIQSEKDWSFVWLPIVIALVTILSIFGVVNYIKAIKKR